MSINLNTTIVTTTPYTISTNTDVVFVNVVGAASIILPLDGTDGPCERSFYIKDYSGNAKTNPITITAAGGKLIDGMSFAVLNRGYAHIQVVYDGTNWKTIS